MTKGQVSVEYLAIFGLVLLAIVAAVSFITGTGFLSPCTDTQPNFAGQPIGLEAAEFTGTNTLELAVSASGNDDLSNVQAHVDTNQNGTFDATSGTVNLAAGAPSETLNVSFTDTFTSGECATMDLGFSYELESLDNPVEASAGSPSLTRTIP